MPTFIQHHNCKSKHNLSIFFSNLILYLFLLVLRLPGKKNKTRWSSRAWGGFSCNSILLEDLFSFQYFSNLFTALFFAPNDWLPAVPTYGGMDR